MGRQVRFYQTEEDMSAFLEFLNTLDVTVIGKNAVGSSAQMKEDIIMNMSKSAHQYVLYPRADEAKQDFGYLVANAIGVIFTSPNRESPFSQTYELGRLYYRKNDKNPRDAEIGALYNRIYKYIRKNYFYNKDEAAYFAPVFLEKYEAGAVFAIQHRVFPVDPNRVHKLDMLFSELEEKHSKPINGWELSEKR